MARQIDPQVLQVSKILKQVCPRPNFEKGASLQKDFVGWFDERFSDIHMCVAAPMYVLHRLIWHPHKFAKCITSGIAIPRPPATKNLGSYDISWMM